MNPQAVLEKLFDAPFEPAADIKTLRQFHAPNAYCCDEAGTTITGICATALKKETLHLPAFPALQYLNITGNESLRELEFSKALPALVHLDISDNGLSGSLKLPGGFDSLLWLDASRNQLEDFMPIGRLGHLAHLDLSGNQLSEFSAHLLTRLPSLKRLFLNENPLSSSKMAASERSGSCLSFLQSFQRDLESGETENKEFKVILVGNGGVGKSCLVERLVYNTFEKRHLSTHGVVLDQYPREQPSTEFPYLLNLWDFAGQDVYHATHRLFMQADAVYLALWDEDSRLKPESELLENGKKQAYENFSLDYWLHYIRHQAGASPILVVKTKCLDNNNYHPDAHILKQRYEVEDFLYIDSKSPDPKKNNIGDIKYHIQKAIENRLPQDKELPQNWADVRQHLRNLLRQGVKSLPFEQYQDIAADYKLDNATLVLEWLVRTGAIFYRKNYFGNALMLDQSWAIEGVYTIFRRDNGFCDTLRHRQKGEFSGADLQMIWTRKSLEDKRPRYSPAEEELLLEFMLSCELCFEINAEEKKEETIPFAERRFVAPQLLPDNVPSVVKVLERQPNMLYLCYRHDFLHQGVIQRFIARAQVLTNKLDIWLNGIVIEEDHAFAVVKSVRANQRGRHAFDIQVQCDRRNLALMDKIRNTLEDLQGDVVQEWVSVDGQDYVKMSELQEWKQEMILTENKNLVPLEPFKVFLERREQGKLQLPHVQHQERTEELIRQVEIERREGEKEIWENLPELAFEVGANLLFVQANPTDDPISWEKEHNSIANTLNKQPGKWKLEKVEKASLVDIIDAVADFQPGIIHFCGHGQEKRLDIAGQPKQRAGLILHNEDGKGGEHLISAPELENSFKRWKKDYPNLQLVCLNACFSREQAEAISRAGIFAIGTTEAILSDVARLFAAGLYAGLLKGESLPSALKRACNRAATKDQRIDDTIEAYYAGKRILPL